MDHFLNWLAVIFQTRGLTKTAWIFQGTTGTGKGLLFNEVIRPLIGESYCRSMTLANLEDQFNKYAEHSIVLFVDEVDTDQSRHMEKLFAELKNMISEPTIIVRPMRAEQRIVNNYQNFIMASNQPNSMRIDHDDRRFNVAPRQEEKLFKPDDNKVEFVAMIRDELPEFSNFLKSFSACKTKAEMALENADKQQMKNTTQTTLRKVTHAINTDDFEYFVDMRPANEHQSIHIKTFFDGQEIDLSAEYYRVLREAIQQCKDGKSHFLNQLDLFALTDQLVGKMPNKKAMFTQRMAHNSIHIGPKSDGKSSLGRGIIVRWRATEVDIQRWTKLLELDESNVPPFLKSVEGA